MSDLGVILNRLVNFLGDLIGYVGFGAEDHFAVHVWLNGEHVEKDATYYVGPGEPHTPGLGAVRVLARDDDGEFIGLDDENQTLVEQWKFGWVMWGPMLRRSHVWLSK